jgi:putative ABC transport system permease protein
VLPPDTAVPIDWRIVSPDFFVTLGVPILKGRNFNDTDGLNGSAVTVVSEDTAERFWGSDDPIGRVIRRVADGQDTTVIGVAGAVRNGALNQPSPAVYYPAAARVWPRMDVVMKTIGTPDHVLPGVRDALRTIDRDVPISTVRTMSDYVSANAAQPRLNAVLLGLFAVVALIVAAVGVYGVLAYSVTQRTREIGLRMALGAQRSRVLGLIVREGMTVGVAGIGLGLVGALALGQTIASLVYDVPVRDPWTFGAVAGMLIAVALAACAIPAQKASRVDPLVALRDE